jgi:predicted Zn-dependent protease
MWPRVVLFACTFFVVSAETSPKEYYDQARKYRELSIQSFERLLKVAPESGYVLALLGEVKTKEKQYTAAIYAFNEAAKRTPKLRGVRSALADVYQNADKPTEAAAAAKAEEQLGKPNCAVEKLYCEYTAGRFESVIKVASANKTPESLYWLTRAYNELSIQSLSRLGDFPDSAEMHRVKAETYHDSGRFREAVTEWRELLKTTPDDRDVEHHLATDLFLTGDFAIALAEL